MIQTINQSNNGSGRVGSGRGVSGAARAHATDWIVDSIQDGGNATTRRRRTKTKTKTRTMAKKTAKERMDKGRDALVDMATVSKPTTLVRRVASRRRAELG